MMGKQFPTLPLPLQLISKGPSMLYFPGKQVLEISPNAQPCKKQPARGLS